MQLSIDQVRYDVVEPPQARRPAAPVDLTAATMALRKERVLAAMRDAHLDCLCLYADREHGANFGYLTGFEPRFEEALLVLHQNGNAWLVLGNESVRMGAHSLLAANTLHTPLFSLPNQPMHGEAPLHAVLQNAGIAQGSTVGVVGWKLFSSALTDNTALFDVPHFVLEALRTAVGADGKLVNATGLFIHPAYGVRRKVNANEIAHFEFGAALAACCVYETLTQLEPGKNELELAQHLAAYGQPATVQTICATGERFTNAVVAPRSKSVCLGDRFAVTMGLRGGLTNRCAFVAADETDLPTGERDYLERVAKPYFTAAANWYANIKPGETAGALYALIEAVAPQSRYGWHLNPGHFTASEEWMSSPLLPGSEIVFESGMMLQMDIIFSVPGYGGCNAEDGIALADEALRAQLAAEYPDTWRRMTERRAYLENVLHIPLDACVLPLSDLCGYVRPLLLRKDCAFRF